MVDDLDLNIIQILEKDGRKNYTDIAKQLGVVEGTVRKRVKNLIDKRLIRIRATPNPREIGFNVIAFMGLQVQISALRHVARGRFRQSMARRRRRAALDARKPLHSAGRGSPAESHERKPAVLRPDP